MNERQQMPGLIGAVIDGIGSLVVLGLAALLLRAGAAPSSGIAPIEPPGLAELGPCVLDRLGYIHGQAYGAIRMRVDWTGRNVDCGGMTRPGARGIRLAFASRPGADSDRLMFVLGIDGALESLIGAERAVNLTIIDERSGRFFGTRGAERCWTRVRELLPLDGPGRSLRIDGDLYCAGSIPSLTDNTSVTLSDFHYSGRLTLDTS